MVLQREEELAGLDAQIAGLRAGGSSALAVVGEAGIGKTTLLAHAVARASAAGLRVLHAAGSEHEEAVTFGLVQRLLRGELDDPDRRAALLQGAAALAAPVLDGATPGPGAVHGLSWLVVALAAERPTLLVVDDAHWADESTLALLAALLVRLDDAPLGLLVGARDREGGPGLASLLATSPLRVLRPAPLSRRAAAELVQRLAPAADEAVALACARVAGGNPFLVEQLAREVAQRADISADGLDAMAPETVVRSVLARLSRLGDPARPIAHALAVLGTGATTDLLAQLAGVDDAAVLQALPRLADVGLVDPAPPPRFVHPVLRSAVESDAGPYRTAELHARAAELLAARHAPAGRVAEHLLAAQPAGRPDRATTLAVAAGEAAESGAHATARALLARALAEPPAPDAVTGIAVALGELEFAAGLAGAAVDALRAALAAAPDDGARVRATIAMSNALMQAGELIEAVAVVDNAAAALDASQEELRLALAAHAETIAVWVPALEPRTRVTATPPAGDTPGRRVALSALALRGWATGDRPAAEVAELARRAWAGGMMLQDVPPSDTIVVQTGYAALLAGEPDAATAMFATARDAVVGSSMGFGGLSAMLAHAHLAGGRPRAAEEEAAVALEALSMAPPGPYRRTVQAATMRAAIPAAILRDRADDALATLARLDLDGELSGNAYEMALYHERAGLRLALGDGARCATELAALAAVAPFGTTGYPAAPGQLLAAQLAGRRGDAESARRHADDAVGRAERWGAPGHLGAALRTRGAVLGQDGDLEEAVAVLRDAPARHELALALFELGSAQRRGNQRRLARDTLRMALDVAQTCGARGISVRIHAELVVAGARPRREAISGADALTASERRVATLAAEGRTNREIAEELYLTLKTVESHLTSSYRKLDIGGRAQLGDALDTASAS